MTERVEEWSDTGAELVRPGREDRELALCGWVLASRHWRVQERDVRTFGIHESGDALGSWDPQDASASTRDRVWSTAFSVLSVAPVTSNWYPRVLRTR